MASNGVNIWSGAGGGFAALTNPTARAKEKGNLFRDYPLDFRGKQYKDAEAAYHGNTKGLTFEEAQEVCFLIVVAKLTQYPDLVDLITRAGGVAWLEACSHYTNAATDRFQRWEGKGRESAYLRALIRAFEAVTTGEIPYTGPAQIGFGF